MIESGDLKELDLLGTLTCISGRGVRMDYLSLVNWLTLLENFVCNKTNFKLYPVSDW